jgi:hypothetical protein
MSKEITMLSDVRTEKFYTSGDYEAKKKHLKEVAYQTARDKYLQDNPEVGVLMRKGKEVFYKFDENREYKEFSPKSVISL